MSELPPYVVSCSAGVFDKTTRADLTASFDAYIQDPDAKALLVNFHGGLIKEDRGLSVANALHPQYAEVHAHSLFMVWHSGLADTLLQSLPQIAQEPIFKKLLEKVLGATLRKFGQGTRGDGFSDPDVDAVLESLGSNDVAFTARQLETRAMSVEPDETGVEEFQAALRQDLDFMEAIGSTIVRGGADTRSVDGASLISPEFLEQSATEGVRAAPVSTTAIIVGLGKVLLRVIKRMAAHRDHGLYTTAVEEILREFYVSAVGTFVWSEMKAHAKAAFDGDGQSFAGTALLEEMKRAAESGKHRFILVGHSTGAVWICHLLAKAAEVVPEATFEVVFLAPACTFDLFSATVESHAARIAGLRIFGMKDEVESRDRLVSVLYPKSLLYFVSGILESEADQPILGMARFYEEATPYAAIPPVGKVKEFLKTKPNWAVWSETAADASDGLRSTSHEHGRFDLDELTVASIKHIISAGFSPSSEGI